MRYKQRVWYDQVKTHQGTKPFTIRSLPEELRVTSLMKPLERQGWIRCVGWEKIKATNTSIKVWQVVE